MSETLNFDAPCVPVIALTKDGRQHVVRPVEFLGKVEQLVNAKTATPGKARREPTIREATEAIRQASGIPTLTDDEAALLHNRAELMVLRSQEAKKKLSDSLRWPGSTPASEGSEEPKA